MFFDRRRRRSTRRPTRRSTSSSRRTLRPEALEARLLLAADLYVDDAYVTTTDTNNIGVLDAGDEVTYGDGEMWAASGLVFGTNAFTSIQDAINAAAAGDTVHVAEGTFTEDVVVNQDISLVADGARANTTIQGVSSGYTGAVRIAASGATLGGPSSGFTITSPGVAGVYVVGGVTNATVQGNLIQASSGHNALLAEGGVHNLTIDANTLTGAASQLIYINGQTSVSIASTNVDITNNVFSGSAPTGPLLGLESTGGDITGNQFIGSTSYTGVELWGGGNNISGNTFGVSGGGSQVLDPLAQYNMGTILGANTFSTGAVTVEHSGNLLPQIWSAIGPAIGAAAAGDTVHVGAGTYVEDVLVNKNDLKLLGEGPLVSIISGPIGGDGATVRVTGSNVEVAGFTITREGNNTTDWNNAGLNYAGVAVQGQATTGLSLHDNLITGNRSGIDINNSNGHTIRNNVITNNHTGMIFRNQTDNLTLTENAITDNRTVGVLFLDASSGSNSPVQTALNATITNNNISGNWYGQIVDRQTGGSLPLPGTTNLKNFAGNWLGSATPVITTANSAEPGYASLIPVTFGGTAVPPGGQPDVAGPASANLIISPILTSGVDTNVETTPGRGTYGFQGSLTNIGIVGTGVDDILAVIATGPDSGTYQLTSGGVPGPVVPFSGLTSLSFAGLDGTDLLTIQYPSNGQFIPIFYDGGTSPGDNDTLEIHGGSFDHITKNFTDAHSGNIVLDPTGPGSTSTITYTGLEPVLIDVGSVGNVEFNLPAGAYTAIVEDDPGAVANRSQIRSLTGAFETTEFTHPTGSLIINAAASNVVRFAMTETLGAANVVVGGASGIEAGFVSTSGNVTLTASGAITEFGADGAADIVANGLSLNAGAGINVDTNVTSLSAVNSTSGSILIDETNGVTLVNVTNNNAQITINTTSAGNVVAENVDAGSGNVNITVADGNLTSGSADAGVADIVGNTVVLALTTGNRGFGASSSQRLEINAVQLTANNSGNGTNFAYIVDTAGGVTMDLSSIGANGGTIFDLQALNGSILSSPPANSGTRDLGATQIVLAVTGVASTIGTSSIPLEINAPTGTAGAVVNAQTQGGGIYLRDTTDNFPVGLINAGTGEVRLVAVGTGTNNGQISDANGAANNVLGSAAVFIARGGIGTSADYLEVEVDTLAASNNTAGDIRIANLRTSLLTIGTVVGTSGVKNTASGGHTVVTTPRGFNVTQSSSAGGSLRFTGGETSATNNENIAVAAGVTLTATTGNLTLEVGDNFSFPAGTTLAAPGGSIFINSLDTAADPEGSTFDSFGDLNATSAKFTGGDDSDTFNITVDANTPINVEGNDPTPPTLPGDVLNINGATLLTITGVGTGVWSGGGAGLTYIEIETVTTTSAAYDLVVDMGAAGLLPYNSVDAQLDGANGELEIRVDTDDDARNGTLAFNGDVNDIRSLAVLGSSGNDVFSITQNANNLLPGQSGGLGNSSPIGQPLNASFLYGRTPNSPNGPAFHFTGGDGDDTFRLNLNLAEDVGYFADSIGGAGSGDVNVQGKLAASFNTNERVDINQMTTGGSIVVDASSLPSLSKMTITDIGSATEVVGNGGFATAEFRNAANVTVRSGLGQDTIDLVSIDAAGLGLVTLDGDSVQNSDIPVAPNYDNADDTIRVRSLPAGVSALLLGGLGSDTFQLYDSNNTVDNILGVVTVAGEDGNVPNNEDVLYVRDFGDATGDVVTVFDDAIAGLTGYGAGNGIVFTGIDLLDVTTTAGDDLITVDMDNPAAPSNAFDLNVAHIRGNDGQDTFLIDRVENLTDLFLYGDGPNNTAAGDLFGTTAQRIRPSLTTVIHIDGGTPTPVAPAGNIPGDRLNLDMSQVSASQVKPVLVDTVGGIASSASHQNILFGDIEWVDLVDLDGQTNTERGDLYLRASEMSDRITLYPYTTYRADGRVRIRYNRTDLGPFATTSSTITSIGLWIVYGRNGNDQITVNNTLVRDTELYGQVGNDYLAGSANGGRDLLVGGSGNDRLQGLAGDDILWGDKLPTDTTDLGPDGRDRLNGGKGNDVLDAGGNNDYAYGEDGDDIVRGGDGDDSVSGDRGNDIVIGGAGKDRVNGGFDRDIVIGGYGVDTVDGDYEDDIVIGDASIWDDNTPANDAALLALMFGPSGEYWTSPSDYATRVSGMRSSIAGKIFEDNDAKDTLIGDSGQDWFWDIMLNDKYVGKKADEIIN
jgi:hypothetical protein